MESFQMMINENTNQAENQAIKPVNENPCLAGNQALRINQYKIKFGIKSGYENNQSTYRRKYLYIYNHQCCSSPIIARQVITLPKDKG